MYSRKNRILTFVVVLIFTSFSFNLFISSQSLTNSGSYSNFPFRLIRKVSSSISQRAETTKKLLLSVLSDHNKATALLQYGVTTGYEPLRRQVAQIAESRGIEANYENNISIFNGRDDMLDTLARIFINPGDTVFVYTNSDLSDKAIGCFQHYNVNVLGCDTLEELRNSIEDAKKRGGFYNSGNQPKAKFIYADSSVMSEDEIIKLRQLAQDNGLFIIEDATAVGVAADNSNNIKVWDDDGTVVYMGNLDSVLGPGLQTSYIIGANEVMRKLEWAKGAQTLHPNSFAQVLISEYLREELGIRPQAEEDIFKTEEHKLDLDYFLSETGEKLSESAIRGILKIIQRSEVISLAGGIPASELFPVKKLADIVENMSIEEWGVALDRITPAGHNVLREAIADWLGDRNIQVNSDEVLVTSGSQNGLDIIARVLNRKGKGNATIFTPDPVYLGAANAFQTAGCDVNTYTTLDNLRDELSKISESGRVNTVIYLTPTFANPAGNVISLEEREEYLEIAKEYGIQIIEDNPYGELRYEGQRVPTIRSLDEEGDTVVYLTSNSKVFSPGMRMGYVVSEGLINGLTGFKNETFGVSNSLVQVIISKFITDGEFNLDNHVNDVLIPTYTKRKNAMLDALAEAEKAYGVNIEYTPSEGGLFVWVELPKQIDTETLLVKTAGEENGVVMDGTVEEYGGEKVYAAFVPGTPFSVEEGSHSNYMRLCFSTSSEQDIRKAVLAIMQAVRDEVNGG